MAMTMTDNRNGNNKNTTTNNNNNNSDNRDNSDNNDNNDNNDSNNSNAPCHPNRNNRNSQKEEEEEQEEQKYDQSAAQKILLEGWKKEEDAVLRECMFILQGMDGDCRLSWIRSSSSSSRMNPKFLLAEEALRMSSSTTSSSFVLEKNITAVLPPACVAHSRLGSGAKDALALCAEAGWLYGRVQKYIDSVNHDGDNDDGKLLATPPPTSSTTGSIARAFAAALRHELQDYLQFLQVLEQEIQQQELHLREIRVRLREPIRQLQSLAILTDSLQHLNGGPLLAAIQKHVYSGDPRHVAMVHRLLAATSKPWFQMLHLWITEGILSDPAHEFFVTPTQISHNNNNNAEATTTTTTGNSNSTKTKLVLLASSSSWKDFGFELDYTKLPGAQLMQGDGGCGDTDFLVESAFRVGKGVNFIRQCLMDGEWSFGIEFVQRAKRAFCYNYNSTSRQQGQGQEAETTTTTAVVIEEEEESNPFRSTLTEAMHTVHSHILNALHTDHHLLLHLYALKQFMFLGHGDFYTVLMDGLSTEFGDDCDDDHDNRMGGGGGNKKKGAGIYRHTLVSVLESALRSTNANYFPLHVLERLEIDWDWDTTSNSSPNLLLYGFAAADDANTSTGPVAESSDADDASNNNKDQRRIWDIFALDYTVPEALGVVVDDDAKAEYRRVFKSLFGLRTVEYHLNSTWRMSATLQHTLHAVAQQNGITVRTSQSYANTIALLRQIAMTRQAMVHFVVNLKSYVMFEVLEGGWKQIVQDIQDAQTLDDIVSAHCRYITNICRKCFLNNNNNNNNNNESGAGAGGTGGGTLAGYTKLGSHMNDLLELCKQFCTYQQHIFGIALEAAEQAKEARRRANERAAVGDWGFATTEDIVSEENTFFGLADSIKRNDLSILSNAFHYKIKELLACTDEILNGGAYITSSSSTNRNTPSATTTTTTTLGRSSDTHYYQGRGAGGGRLDDSLDSLRFLIFQLDQNNYYETYQETTTTSLP